MIVKNLEKWKKMLLELQAQLVIERRELPPLQKQMQANIDALRETTLPLQEGGKLEANLNEIVAEFPES